MHLVSEPPQILTNTINLDTSRGGRVARQARAEATHGKIIDAAVELFAHAGYGDTDLAAIVRRAGITKGAFYYHFESKEQVADAIIAEGNIRLRRVFFDADQSSSSALQSLIIATFGVARLMRADLLVGTSNLLGQALGHIGHGGQVLYPDWVELFVGYLKTVAAQGDLRTDVDPAEAGETVCATAVGSQLLSDALGDDVCGRLARAWRVLLVALVPSESVSYFQEFLARIAAQYDRPELS
jgi:AcrR family transcriptional regulator